MLSIKLDFVTKKIIHPKDSDLFRQTVGDVRAVKNDKAQLKDNKPKPFPKPKTYDSSDSWQGTFELELDNVSHEESLSYTAPGIQNNVLAKLRKGFFGLQAELDLHGLTSEAARQQLLNFLQTGTPAGYRCVHIIHGKGYRSPEGHPVLKNRINLWLRQHKAVQAFCSAPQRQGGAGAVYVLLKILQE
jgi:DNA-nicking Smr family endonuclease